MKMRYVFSPRRRRSFSEGLSRLGARGSRRRKLRLEPLESRLLLATNFLVDSLADVVADDDGVITLREATSAANADAPFSDAPAGSGHDLIEFAPDLAGGTITLDLGELHITDDLDLVGLGATDLTIAAGQGRVFYFHDSVTDATISDLTISGGSGVQYGGGILNEGTLLVANSTISGNSAVEHGGGIFNRGTLSVVNSTISGNWAVEHGGGIYSDDTGTLSVVNSTISGNSASLDGGGIAGAATLSVVNSTISGNSARYGGGIGNVGTLSAVNSTIVENTADANNIGTGDGGGIATYGGSTTLHNTIVAGNVRGTAAPVDDDLSGPVQVQAGSSYNLIGDADTSGGLQDGENGNIVGVENLEWLEPLGDYGGTTLTHALLLGSPAINAGDPAFDPNTFDPPLLTDQRGDGFARIFGGAVDMGAFECQFFVVSTLDDEDDPDHSPGDLSLREALGLAAEDPAKDEIRFDPGLAGGTIALALGELAVTSDLDLLGQGVKLDAAGESESRVLFVASSVTDATISDLTITGGLGDAGGGILNEGTLSVINSTISGNSAQAGGGGIHNTGTLSVVNSTISGNLAEEYGGGIRNAGTLSAVNSTISDNSADTSGGGVYTDSGASTTLHNTIVAGNLRGTAEPPVPDDLSGDYVQTGSSYNLVGDADTSGGLSDGENGNIVGVEVLDWLAPLGGYGGPTQTHALLSGSPAIDAGDPDFDPNDFDPPLLTDQRGEGFARIFGGAVDMGALECQFFVVSTLLDENDPDHSPGDLSLREALGLAASNPGKDVIQFDPGLAGDTITLDGALGELQITSDLDLVGPGATDLTIDAEGNCRVLFVASAVTDATISDLTITGGLGGDGGGIFNAGTLSMVDSTISGNWATKYGGGIYSMEGTLSLTNSTISNNSAAKDGGGIYSHEGGLTIASSTISGSSAGYDGGGIYSYQGSLTITNSTISGNSATKDGGGIYHYRETLTVANSTISGNSAGYDGGGIYHYRETLTVANSTISGNSAGYDGGGICSIEGTLSVANSTISSNSANGGGGGIYSRGGLTIANSTISGNEGVVGGGICSIEGTLSVANSTISGNSAWDDGGGIYSRGGLTIANSTISGNSAWDEGGGIWVSSVWLSSPLTVVNSTIVENTADANDGGGPFGQGGGVYAEDYADRPTSLHHTIVAGNLRGTAEPVSHDLWLTVDEASSYNLIGDEASSGGLLNGVNGNIVGVGDLSWVAPLGACGGPTQTHALLPGSPAIDAGDPDFDPNAFEPPLVTDQRGDGFARIAGGAVDIGAFEVQLMVSTLDDEDDGDHSPGDLSLREALGLAGPGKGVILFVAGLVGRTITLDGSLGPLQITRDVNLLGMGVTLLAEGDCGVLSVDAAVTDATIRDLTITGGDAEYGGGILNEGTLSVVSSTISGNSAGFHGGGIYNKPAGTLSVVNSTISGNLAEEYGGGIYNAGTLSVTNSTIVENTADPNDSETAAGGGVYTDTGGGASTTLHHTIVAGNLRGTAEQSEADDLLGDLHADSSFNLVGDEASSGGLKHGENGNIVGEDPWLAPLGDYGGPTRTHALLPGSPAIDAGNPVFDPNAFDPPLLTDQRGGGFARVFGGAVDIGAFEYQESFIVTTLVDEDDGDLGAGDFSLREALGLAASNPAVKDVIEFAPRLAGGTITLNADLGPLQITSDLDLLARGVTFDAAGNCGVLVVDAAVTDATISDLTITGGRADYGGGILNAGTLSLVSSTIRDNSADYHGGGIYNYGTLSVANSTISGNSANAYGGGICNANTLSVVNLTIVNNTADADGDGEGDGGGVFNWNVGEPPPRPTTVTEIGARHLGTGPTLGTNRDCQSDGTHSVSADDDTTDTADTPETTETAGARSGFAADVDADADPAVLSASSGDSKIDRDKQGELLDYGDAPAPYPTTFAENGARHELAGPTLGVNRDGEADGTHSPGADADDTTGTPDDEDGVTFGSIMVGQLGASVTVNVENVSTPPKLDAWIDFNADGTWGGPFEQIADSVEVLSAGEKTITFDVPSWAVAGETYARFRLSSAGGLGPAGAAADGEVEDYQVVIERPSLAPGVFGVQHVISSTRVGARSVFGADLDGDGHMDVLCASRGDNTIAWYENDGNQNFAPHTISMDADGANSVFAADVDGDGDVDVLSASVDDDKIAWFENLDGGGTFGPQQIISAQANGAHSVFAADIDGDGDLDVLSASWYDNKIAWYENDGTPGGSGDWTVHDISTSAVAATSVFAADVDSDGDMDVLSASYSDNKIAWYENDGTPGGLGDWTEHDISTSAIAAVSVFAADVDSDGDMDVLSASYGDNKIAWYENDGTPGDLDVWTKHVVSQNANRAYSVFAADVDGDGDMDVLSASYADDKIAWYENDGSQNFTAHTISTAAVAAASVFAADVDGDGDLDVLSASASDDKIAWYENRPFDFGDAPAPYPTTFAENGARHDPTGPTLGTNRDEEWDGTHSSGADADDTTGTPDDEDGVTFGPIMVGQLGASVTVNVENVSGVAKLDAWIDFNADGTWGGPFEQIADSVEVLSAGEKTITFDVPSWAVDGVTYARFRLSTDGGLGPAGAAADGEVEDYQVSIESPSPGGAFGVQNVVSTAASGPRPVFAADVDGDGDMDILSASLGDNKIGWYENDGTPGGVGDWTERIISAIYDGPRSVFAADVDGDGDMDVLSASFRDDKIAWHENDGSQSFTAHTISPNADEAISVFAADVDGDGDLDVLSASYADDKIAWYENDGTPGGVGDWTEHAITNTSTNPADGARSVFAADVDGDGDLDVLSASQADHRIAWYENDGSQNFTAHTISNNAYQAISVFAADVDSDGDMDVLSASHQDNTIAWYENDGSQSFTKHVISDSALSAHSVFAADVDGDGDMDVLSASHGDDKITWYENDGSQNFAPRIITTAADGTASVFAADLDGDGDLDVLSASIYDNKIAWYENYKFFELHNTIVAGNHCGSDEPVANDLSGDPVQAGSSHNLVGDAASSGGLAGGENGNIVGVADLDWLQPLGDNGGPTPTHALLPGSPAIDAGNDDLALDPVGDPLATDQRGDGFARIVGGAVDVGAFECQSIVVSTTDDVVDGDHSPGDLSLREALGVAAEDPAKDVIEFAPGLAGGTITLELGELKITSNLDLVGLGATELTIDAAGNSRVFHIATGVTATIRGVTITGGYTQNYGGGILNEGTLSVHHLTIVDNGSFVTWRGGGIHNTGTLSVANSTIARNSARDGGGIQNRAPGTLSVVNSTISGNQASNYGGGIHNWGIGTLSVVANSTIADNSAADGGGIRNDGGNISLANSTISGNSSFYSGGGIRNAGTLSAVNSTISGNSAGVRGGAVCTDSDASTTLHNAIVAGNLGGTAAPDDLSGGPVQPASSYNLVGDAATSGGLEDGENGNIVGVEDLSWLATLGDYGGPTQTHALLPGNPAINQGNNARAVDPEENPLTTDQRGDGFLRIVGGTVDIGAFEVQTIVSTLIDEDDGDHSPGDLSLREALGLAESNPAKDEIRFAPGLAGGAITLDGALGELKITSDLELLGLGVTVDAAGQSRVLFVTSSVTDATISGVTISGGDAEYGGGIYNEGTLSVANSTISGNSADSNGGAIYNEGTLSVVNSTISGNSAEEYGGGIYSAGTLSVTNSTIVDNTADAGNTWGDGGGVYTDINASTTLDNTIVAGNLRRTDEPVPADLWGPVEAPSSYNLVGDENSSGGLKDGENGNIVGVEDLDWLAPLGDYGGTTQTHALLPESSAIDAGNPDFDPNAFDPPLLTDQRGDGFARIGGGAVDMGAFECQFFVVSTLDDENDGDHSPGDLSLREALGLAAEDPAKDEIQFAPGLANGTITLEGALGELRITSNLDLVGLGAPDLTIDAARNSGVLFVDAAVTDATISDLTITGGDADYGGGIYNEGTLSVINSTIWDNSAQSDGGGISNSGTLSVVNSTISGNSAEESGGGILNSGTLSVTNSTIVENKADANGDLVGDGGGVYTDSGASTTLHNTIVAGNLRGTAAPDDLSGDDVQAGSSYNLVGDAATSGGLNPGENGNIVGQAPRLAPLGDYGGPTPTHALAADSPAIDAGNPDFDPNAFDPPLLTDQRGLTRIVDGDRDSVAIIDIGAFEHQQSFIVTTLVDEDDGDLRLGDLSLREALGLAESNSFLGKNEIRFDPGLAGGRITLDGELGRLPITSNLDLLGLGVSLDAAGNCGVLFVHTDVTANVSDLTITGGRADYGGGILNQGTLSVDNLTIAANGNFVTWGGGGIHNAGTLSVANSTIARNSARDGGGIHNTGTLSVTNSTIWDNSAEQHGGGIDNAGTLSVVANSTIADNSAGDGGGIRNAGTLSALVNSTISGNSAEEYGGGIRNAGTLSAVNSTISGNSADMSGGGVYTDSDASTTLHNAIVAGNLGAAAAPDDLSGDDVQDGSSYNLVGDLDTSGGLKHGENGNILGEDPWLAPLSGYGGPTQTHALLPESPAIDAGNPDFDPNAFEPPLLTDQRGEGFARIAGDTADIGAIEYQERFVVTTLADEDDGELWWGDLSLREALGLAARNPRKDEIRFAPDLAGGTIELKAEQSEPSFLGPLEITGNLDLLGLGVTLDAGARSWDDKYRCGVLCVHAGVTATISDLTITGGYAHDAGGILNRGTLSVINSTIAGNYAPYSGGGIYQISGTVTVTHSTIAGNHAAQGGGICQNSGTVTVTDSTISGNSGIYGGGILKVGGTLSVTNSTISGNRGDYYGGGIENYSGTVSVTNSTISGNSARGGDGGGICNRGTLSLINSTISGNSAREHGGGIDNRGTLSVANSTISGNSAGDHGGAIDNRGTLSVANSTISGNTCGWSGGGILNWGGTLTVANSTIVDNTANDNNDDNGCGGGIRTPGGSITTLHNTIVAGNLCRTDAQQAADDLCGTVQPGSSFNLVGDAGSSGGLSDGDENGNIVGWDPLLAPLGDYGGPTQTHALWPDSPAIDTGDPDFDPYQFEPPLLTDQRGRLRVVHGDGDGLARLDIGAYEFGAPLPSDFGDAPDSYSTLLASDGARHTLEPGGPFMGAGVDADPDGQPDAHALGDDLLDGSDDEDGIQFVTPLARGQTANVDIDMTASPSDAVLNSWVDFNDDGDWDDDLEQIFTDASLTAGVVNELSFPVPDTGPYGCTYARFRVSTTAGLSYKGGASDGEVEDYEVLIPKPGDTDLDADVDPSDLAKVVINWDPAGSNPGNDWGKGDFDRDGDVDPSDLSALVQNWSPAGYGSCGQAANDGGHLPPARQQSSVAETRTRAAADAIFERESATHDPSPGKWAWLCDFEQPSTRNRPSKRPNRAENTVDALVATLWP